MPCGGRVIQPGGRLLTLEIPFLLTAFFLAYNSLSPLVGIEGRESRGMSLPDQFGKPGGLRREAHDFVGRRMRGQRG